MSSSTSMEQNSSNSNSELIPNVNECNSLSSSEQQSNNNNNNNGSSSAAAVVVEQQQQQQLVLRVKSSLNVDVDINVPTKLSVTTVRQLKHIVRLALVTAEEGETSNNSRSRSSNSDFESTAENNKMEGNRYVRLICKGRMLTPDGATIDNYNLQNGDVLHAVLAPPGVRGGQQAALARQSNVVHNTNTTTTTTTNNNNVNGTSRSTRRYRGTGIGPLGRIVRPSDYNNTNGEPFSDDDDDDDDDSNNNDEETGRERLGFDRLRASGLSRNEITAIRSYFARQVDRYVEDHPDVGGEETDLMRRRLVQEDAWMSSQGPTSEFRLNLNQNNPLLRLNATELLQGRVGSDRDFLWELSPFLFLLPVVVPSLFLLIHTHRSYFTCTVGFLLGFFVGLIMLVWIWMPTVPHKQKLGILTGISLQLALTLLKSQDVDDLVEDGV